MQPGLTLAAALSLLLSVLFQAGCGDSTASFSGSIFGTSYSAAVVLDQSAATVNSGLLTREFDRVDAEVSTWSPNSAIARFNRAAAGESVVISPETAQLIELSESIREQTGGAFDHTVGPLVELWNFGSRRIATAADAPSDEAIAAAMEAASDGYRVDRSSERIRLVKLKEGCELDFSAIAKGAAVDRGGAELTAAGHDRWLVEIGGEVRASGQRAGGGPWRIGVQNPTGGPFLAMVPLQTDPALRQSQPVSAMATSGDYQNYQIIAGERVSHKIDPRTGRPVTHRMTSATVVAATCGQADAYATACLVMGFDRAIAWAETESIALLAARVRGDGSLQLGQTSAMQAIIGPLPAASTRDDREPAAAPRAEAAASSD